MFYAFANRLIVGRVEAKLSLGERLFLKDTVFYLLLNRGYPGGGRIFGGITSVTWTRAAQGRQECWLEKFFALQSVDYIRATKVH